MMSQEDMTLLDKFIREAIFTEQERVGMDRLHDMVGEAVSFRPLYKKLHL